MIPVILLVIAVVIFRLTPTGWENFSPMAAIVLCSAAYLPKRWAVALPFSALMTSHILLNLRAGFPFLSFHSLSVFAGFALVFALGWTLRRRPNLPLVFSASIAGTFLFYLVTNTASWIWEPSYAKTLSGWFQSLTTGVPGYPPTWVFFRNSLIGDLFFTGIFVSAYVIMPRIRQLPPAHSPLTSSREN